LADALHHFPHQPADYKQERKLGDKKRLRGGARTAVSGESGNRAARDCRCQEHENGAWIRQGEARAACSGRSETRCHQPISTKFN
jgi:hypothetical protein